MRTELSKLDIIAAACARTSASGAEELVHDCISKAEDSLRSKASQLCSVRANQAASSADVEPDSPSAARSGRVSNCRGPRCGNREAENNLTSDRPERRPSRASPRGAANRGATASTQTRAAATQSAQNRVVQQPETASVDASGDIQLCESSYSSASRCCGDPKSCVSYLSAADQRAYHQLASMVNGSGPTGGQSLSDYCAQMQSMGNSGSDVNVSLASVCQSQQSSCTNVCSQLAQKYQSLISTCNGCASQGIYQDAYQRLMARQSNCSGLAGRVHQIASQAIGGTSAAAYAKSCQRQAGGNLPIPMGTNPARSASSPGLNPTQNFAGVGADPATCAANPNSEACRSPSSPQDPSGAAAFAQTNDSNKVKPGNFNIEPSPTTDTSGFTMPANQVEAQAVTTGTVANNSGGGIPGSGGSNQAQLGQAPAKAAAQAGASTDLLQGFQSSQGYSAPYASDDQPSGVNSRNSYFGNTRADSDDGGGGLLGMDLRQFLPGGSRDPQRRIAGIGVRAEINAKEEDIWRRISNKIEEKCRLGILIGCR